MHVDFTASVPSDPRALDPVLPASPASPEPATPASPEPISPLNSDDDPLGDEIAELSTHINAAIYRLLTLILRYDEEGRWAWQGFRSCAHWLSWRTGLSLGPARERIRVARCLPSLPHISAALAGGKLSYSKVRAMTRMATAENEEQLLTFATHGTTAHVERLVRERRRMQACTDASAAERAARRGLSLYPADDGDYEIRGRLAPEVGALLLKALQGTEDKLYREQRAAGVPAETSARLCCDAEVVPVTRGTDGSVLDVGRRRRTVDWRLRKALEVRDGGCRFPGCDSRLHTHAHHIRHWARGGETALDNLVLLCPFHHRTVHEGGWQVEMDARGVPRFFNPLGVHMPVVPEAPEVPEVGGLPPDFGLARWHGRDGIGAWTGTTLWQGGSPDLNWALDWFARKDGDDLSVGSGARSDGGEDWR